MHFTERLHILCCRGLCYHLGLDNYVKAKLSFLIKSEARGINWEEDTDSKRLLNQAAHIKLACLLNHLYENGVGFILTGLNGKEKVPQDCQETFYAVIQFFIYMPRHNYNDIEQVVTNAKLFGDKYFELRLSQH